MQIDPTAKERNDHLEDHPNNHPNPCYYAHGRQASKGGCDVISWGPHDGHAEGGSGTNWQAAESGLGLPLQGKSESPGKPVQAAWGRKASSCMSFMHWTFSRQ